MIRIEDLWVRYRGSNEYVLRDINIEVRKGFVVFAGPTGCGKSTLARVLIGVVPHIFPGEVKGNVDILGVDPIRDGIRGLIGKVSYVAQNPELYLTAVSVEEELYFVAMNIGMSPSIMDSRVGEIVDMLGIKALLDKSTLNLSSGQQQILGIGSQLVIDPKIIILDEPLSRLDPENYVRLISVLRYLASEKLVIVFEHHMDVLIDYADKVYVMNEGKIVAEGTPEEVREELYQVDPPILAEILEELDASNKILFSNDLVGVLKRCLK